MRRENADPKGPKYLYGTKYGFCSSNFPYGLGKYSPYGYLGTLWGRCWITMAFLALSKVLDYSSRGEATLASNYGNRLMA